MTALGSSATVAIKYILSFTRLPDWRNSLWVKLSLWSHSAFQTKSSLRAKRPLKQKVMFLLSICCCPHISSLASKSSALSKPHSYFTKWYNRTACSGTVQYKGLGFPNKHFATQKVFLYRRKHCLQMQTLYIRLPCLLQLWSLSMRSPRFENHFAIETVRFQVQLEADGYFSVQEIFAFAIVASRASWYQLAIFWIRFFKSDFKNTCWASPKPDIQHKIALTVHLIL